MDKTVGYSIAGVMALIVFFSLTPTVTGQLEEAQFDATELDEDTVSLDALENITTDTVTTNESYDQVRVTTDQVEGDGTEVTLVIDGEDEETVDADEEIVSGEVDNDSDLELDLEETEDDTAEVDYTIDGEEEDENAELFALVFLIFIVAFAGAFYKAVV